MADEFDSAEALQEPLSDVLTKWPLYRVFVYTGKNCHLEKSGSYGQKSRFGLLPKQIRFFCGHKECGYETLWEISDPEVYFRSEFIKRDSYTCRNCGETTVNYCFIWQERESNNIFIKVGQYPELEERVPDTLKQALDGGDLKAVQERHPYAEFQPWRCSRCLYAPRN